MNDTSERSDALVGAAATTLDIVIPVYNEGENILSVIGALKRDVRTPFRILICYDFEEDNTLPAIRQRPEDGVAVIAVRNPERGPHAAVRAGLKASSAPAVLVYMADDDYNTAIIDTMVGRMREGYELVAACRFMPGGTFEGCAWHKRTITRLGTFMLSEVAGLPVHDGTNAFRLFSRRLLEAVDIESRIGFTFSVELLAKAVRLGFPVAEVPADWQERADKPSRFRVFRWMPAYIHWLLYAMATRWLGRGPSTVTRRLSNHSSR